MNLFIDQLFSLKGKTAVITGGTGVLGGVMVKGLAAAGASVVIIGRRLDAGQALANEIIATGGTAMAIAADVLNKEQLVTAREAVLKKFGAIDILVNAAGGNMP